VKGGGTLYVSGDASYDLFRRRTLTSRLTELCGVEFVAERYPNIACDANKGLPAEIGGQSVTVNPAIAVKPASAEVLLAAGDDAKTPVLLRHSLGKGRVVYSTWPLEFDQGFDEKIAERNALVYRSVLAAAGFAADAPPEGTPGPALPITVPLAGATGKLWVNPTDQGLSAYTGGGDVSIKLAPNRSGLAVWAKNGNLLALEEGESAHVVTYALDREDLRTSKQLCVLPLTEGTVRFDTRASWANPVAIVGEVVGGQWVEYERLEAPVKAGSIRLDIDQDRCFSIIVVAEEAQVKECTTRVVRSLTEPWRARPKG